MQKEEPVPPTQSTSDVAVTPWEGADPPTEAAIRARFAGEGLRPYWWSNEPGDHYAAHRHPYHKVLYVVGGSIRFVLHPGGPLDLGPGDRLDLPPGVEHSAVVGEQGVTCLEAARE